MTIKAILNPMSVCLLIGMIVLAQSVPSAAANPSPVGLWKTLDDKTGEPKSVIKVWIDKGELFGRIETLVLKPGENPHPLCEECYGDKKGQPVIGMMVLWGHKQEGQMWSGGFVLDPENGKTYNSTAQVIDGGGKLEVRGFIGLSLFGRTQTWVRAE
jgi:uncharacterized protein (DUF2147 family)